MTDEAFVRMAIAVDSLSRVDDGWVVRGTSQGLSVEARLTPATERLTRIAVQVETGRLSADKQTSEELHNQIARVLTERLESSRPPARVREVRELSPAPPPNLRPTALESARTLTAVPALRSGDE